MKSAGAIARIRLRRVRLPLSRAFATPAGAFDYVDRCIVEVETQSGLVGLGETGGSPEAFAMLLRAAPAWIARDALLRQPPGEPLPTMVASGLDLALWDIAARAAGLPLASLFGGARRPLVALALPVPAVALSRRGGRDEVLAASRDPGRAGQIGRIAGAAALRLGIGTVSWRSPGTDPRWDAAVLAALRVALGPDRAIRVNGAGAWPLDQAVAVGVALRPHAPEWLADWAVGAEALRRLRRVVGLKLAATVPAPAATMLRERLADVWLAEPTECGGLTGLGELTGAAALFGVPVQPAGRFESGIGLAALLHWVAARPAEPGPVECGAPWLKQDVVLPPIVLRDGAATVPEGPGLGVTLDAASVGALTIAERVVEG